MRDVLPTLRQWNDDGRRFVLATVVRTRGSAPRAVGSVLGYNEDGNVVGSVSGGCIESAVVDACQRVLATSQPAKLSFPRSSSDGTHEEALMCGGESEVWVTPKPHDWDELVNFVVSDTGCVLATRFDPFAQTVRRAGDVVCCSFLDTCVSEAYQSHRSQLMDVAGEEWFMNVVPPRPRLLIVGAVHIARALVAFAKQLGFETIVVDPRSAYAQFEAEPDALIHNWPQDAFKEIKLDEDTYAVALTHDPKIDDAAIELLLNTNVAYIGALGSPKTQAKRRDALQEKGFTEEQLARVHGPVGLDIGAENPEEIALAVIAEVTKVRRARG
jgi:xanthine dehydrogenase accessory factor